MEIHELQQLLSEMSLQEKIGQMVQLTGVYFDKEAVLTGVVGEQLPPEWIIQYAGSVLGVIGKDKIYDIQSRIWNSIPIIFRFFLWQMLSMDVGRFFRFRWGRRVHFIRNWCLRRLL